MKLSSIFRKKGEISGFITKEEKLILKNISVKHAGPHRKSTYNIWVCNDGHSFYYKVARCPECESMNIEEKSIPVRNMEVDDLENEAEMR